MIHRKLSTLLVVFGVLLTAIPAAPAQTNSNKVDVALSAAVIQSLSLIAILPSVAFGTVTPGATNAGQAPVSFVSTWNLGSGQTVKLYAFFDSATAAMTGALTGQSIPASAVKASFNGGATQGFNSTSPFTSGSTAMTLYSVPITSSNLVVTRTDSLALTLDLTSLNSLPTDAYTGTMHLQAQAL